ncbi:hypothetical protein PF008_g18890 [Phytophthora fragariae]|uniref:Uncharacterized protein n=1 Tax=Phytophthora fragariae TaxID=53985 RepID=A0A6G0R3Z7_9STRA|nr:hypothetical protein PF008_g18890 [Phytophthora fragariae]
MDARSRRHRSPIWIFCAAPLLPSQTGGCLHVQRPLPHAALPRARGATCVVRGGLCHASSTNTTRARSAE